MVRAALLVVGLLVGCSSGPGKGTTPPQGGGGPEVAEGKQNQSKPGKKKDEQLGEITFPSCGDASCVLHRGTGRYHVCLMSSDGKCAHFGQPCNPDGGCMYDPKSSRYRSCKGPLLGSCPSYGADCQPKASCQIDPKDGLYRVCTEPAAGACKSFGAVCGPGSPESR